ncbi:MAG TPA: GtrA family protein [Chloroflexota bacterium]|jgi:putative flippase GtrA|nr:GtrA family protein [Chloroflexota bacterium]
MILGFRWIRTPTKPARGSTADMRHPALSKHTYTRVTGFAAVGLAVFAAGACLLYGLVHFATVEPHVAYFITAIFSIEANFLLNRVFNWHDRAGHILRQLAAFHVTKIATVFLNQLLFAVLLSVHVEYMAAMVMITALIAGINYITNDRFVFRRTAVPASFIGEPLVRVGRSRERVPTGFASPPPHASEVSTIPSNSGGQVSPEAHPQAGRIG